MCGIAGFLDPGGARDAESIKAIAARMALTLLHRGPDDEGTWADPAHGIGFGHRRLAVIDVSSAGRQPMVSRSGRYVVAFNGEIYNFRELRRALEGRGRRFAGNSDTEVMLEAIDEWGPAEAIPRLNGMFAFAVWDRTEAVLHLVRDRIGEKPLYYGSLGGALVFASELKAFRFWPGFVPRVDPASLLLYLRHAAVPCPRSIFEGIRKLPPGCALAVRPGDVREPGEPAPYWSAADAVTGGTAAPFAGGADEAADALEALLRDAVRLRMEADVPLGAFLSGGVDSSTIVALMQAQSAQRVRTFTIGFTDPAYDESGDARAVAAHLGTDHTDLIVTPSEAAAVIPRLPAIYDEPFSDSSQIPTVLVSELARRSVTVSLSGDGGDELFGGYNRHVWGETIRRKTSWMPATLRRAAAGVIDGVSPEQWDAAFRIAGGVLPSRLRVRAPSLKMAKLAVALRADEPEAVYRGLVSQWKDPAAALVHPVEQPAAAWPWGNGRPVATGLGEAMMVLDLVSYLPDDILVKVDRATMSVSLEGRMPFLDHRVVEFAWRLPLESKIRDGQGKRILRKVLARYVPTRLTERPKWGFGVPIGDWIRGPLREWAEDLLAPRRLADDGFFDPAVVRRTWEGHVSGARRADTEMWSVLMFQAWLNEQRAPVEPELTH